MKKLMLVCALGALVSGCATQGKSTFQYTPPTLHKVDNELVVDAAYTKVWDKLVRELAKSFYVINNIDKESRIINLSFSATDPSDFVDCGTSQRSFVEGSSTENYIYKVASRSTFKVAASTQEHPAFSNYAMIHREPTLEGRSNIYLAPLEEDPSKTRVSVNTRYMFNARVKGEAFAKHISGAIHPRGRLPEESTSLSFNTNGVGVHDEPPGPSLKCIGTGKLETEILDLVRRL